MSNTSTLPRAGAACGVIFQIGLFLAVGNGTGYSPGRAVAATAALVLFVPFLAALYDRLRAAQDGGWLAATALAAGVAGITLKLASGVPEIALHRAHVADGTQLYDALTGIGDAATAVSLYPLALLCAAVAVLTLRAGVLPRWLGIGAAVTAAALAVNGSFLGGEAAPALLLFLLWTLCAGVALYPRGRRVGVAYEASST
jgi:hypothetical protein